MPCPDDCQERQELLSIYKEGLCWPALAVAPPFPDDRFLCSTHFENQELSERGQTGSLFRKNKLIFPKHRGDITQGTENPEIDYDTNVEVVVDVSGLLNASCPEATGNEHDEHNVSGDEFVIDDGWTISAWVTQADPTVQEVLSTSQSYRESAYIAQKNLQGTPSRQNYQSEPTNATVRVSKVSLFFFSTMCCPATYPILGLVLFRMAPVLMSPKAKTT